MPVLELAFQLAPTLPRAREPPRDAVFGDDLYQARAASLAVSLEARVQVMGGAEIVPSVLAPPKGVLGIGRALSPLYRGSK